MNPDTQLQSLQYELNSVKSLSEKEVCDLYNAEKKSDIIEAIEEEIEVAKKNTFDYTEEELEEERCRLCVSQGISRYC